MNESKAGGSRTADVPIRVRVQAPSRKPRVEARLLAPRRRLFGAAAGLLGLLLAGPVEAAVTPPTLVKAFGVASIAIGQTTSLTFSINNPNAGTTLTNISFNDSLPSGLVVATPNGLANSCGGNLNAGAGVSTVFVDSVTLAPGASCTWSVNVVATAAGTKNNVTSAIFATESGAGSTATASITVLLPANPVLSKAFGAASIAIGQTTSLTFTIANPNATFTTLTNISFIDSLPSGLVVATPNGLVNNCGGNVNADAGVSTVFINAVTLAPGSSCTWSINVVANSAGIKNNVTSAISSTESGTGGAAATASIAVPLPANPVLSKAFGAASIAIGQTTSLTFTIANPNATFTTLTNVAFNDSLPSGLLVATPNGLANSCGGNVDAGAGVSFLTVNLVTLAPGASCAWSINVIANSAGIKNNVTSAISSTESGNGGTAATASITVLGTPQFMSAASRRVHGAAGTFDLPLLLTPTSPTTEPRVGPTQTIVLSFDKPIASADTPTVSEGVATFGTMAISGNDVVVTFTGVTDMQYVTISVANVASTDGGTGGSASVRIGLLVGDVNQNRVVTVGDLGLVNAQLSQMVTSANYLKDVNVSGTLSVADKGITNANLTRALPPP
jgi:trimeric autotransporter adhesin